MAAFEPCQPIGCDAGFHLPGCPLDVVDEPLGDPRLDPWIEGNAPARSRECPHGFWIHDPENDTCPKGCTPTSSVPRDGVSRSPGPDPGPGMVR